MVYFKDGDRICTAKLGQDVSEAKVLMKESREGVQESHWKFWADEDTVYAMHRALTSEGYVDTLYRLNDSEAEKLWNSKILLELGAEDIILDGNAKWYINNGILYYYTSGGSSMESRIKTGLKTMIAVKQRRSYSAPRRY